MLDLVSLDDNLTFPIIQVDAYWDFSSSLGWRLRGLRLHK